MSVTSEFIEFGVVGGGISGLSCAKRMLELSSSLQKPIRVTVFDKSWRVGGRCATKMPRASTLRSANVRSWENANVSFDHGAQYFTTKYPEFTSMVEQWKSRGLVRQWQPRLVALQSMDVNVQSVDDGVVRYVGVPGMNSIVGDMAEVLLDNSVTPMSAAPMKRGRTQPSAPVDTDKGSNLRVQHSTLLTRVQRGNDGKWLLWGHTSAKPEFRLDAIAQDDEQQEDRVLGKFDYVVVALPPFQAEPLLRSACSSFGDVVSKVGAVGCWTTCVAFKHKVTLPFDGAFVNGLSRDDDDEPRVLRWMARNSSKPGRELSYELMSPGQSPMTSPVHNALSPSSSMDFASPDYDCWVLHSSKHFFDSHVDSPEDQVGQEMQDEFSRICGAFNVVGAVPAFSVSHKWRYSRPTQTLEAPFLVDSGERLGVCGDYFIESRVEGAFMSGYRLAEYWIDMLSKST